jgi:hypothetical protein
MEVGRKQKGGSGLSSPRTYVCFQSSGLWLSLLCGGLFCQQYAGLVISVAGFFNGLGDCGDLARTTRGKKRLGAYTKDTGTQKAQSRRVRRGAASERLLSFACNGCCNDLGSLRTTHQ